jgi:hypothetical protein
MNALLETALTYARTGLPVFPLHPRSKIPFGKPKPEEGKKGHVCAAPLHQHGFKDATTDPAVIEAWWGAHPAANIGLATGRGLDVLDVDGPEGETALVALVARRWPLPETCEVRTGRDGGGRQLHFRSAGWPNSVSRLGPKLDTRGLGGFVLLPPSVHPSGATYAWTNLSAPAGAPAWLTALLYRAPEPATAPTTLRTRLSNEMDALGRASRYLAEMPAAISGHGGHLALWAAARALRGFRLTKDEVFELLLTEYNPRCVPQWSKVELRHKANEAFSKAKKVPELRDLTERAS